MNSNIICGFTDIELREPDITGHLYHAEIEKDIPIGDKSNCIKKMGERGNSEIGANDKLGYRIEIKGEVLILWLRIIPNGYEFTVDNNCNGCSYELLLDEPIMIEGMDQYNSGYRQRILGSEVPENSDSKIRIQKENKAIEGIVSKTDNSEMALFYAVPDGLNAFVGAAIDVILGQKSNVAIGVTHHDSGKITIVIKTKTNNRNGGYDYNSYRVDTDEAVWATIQESNMLENNSSESILEEDAASVLLDSLASESTNDPIIVDSSSDSGESKMSLILMIVLAGFSGLYVIPWIW